MHPALKNSLHCIADNALRRHAVVLHRGSAGSMLVAGEERWSRYLPERFFGAAPRERRHLGTYRAAQLPAALARWRNVADITIVRVDQLSQRLFSPTDWLRVPEWIRMVAPVPTPPGAFAASSARSDLRRVRKNGLTWRVSHDPADLAIHLRRDYYSYIRLRHGEDAFVMPPRRLQQAFRRGGLLWVEKEGAPLAGLVFEHAPPLLGMLTVACVEADPRHLQYGALAGAYLFSFEYARSRGLAALDMRGNRPCLRDPLFFFKQKYGATVHHKSDNAYELLVRWNVANDPVLRFLSESPLIFRDGHGLAAIHAATAAAGRPQIAPGLDALCTVPSDAPFGHWHREPLTPTPA